MKVLIRHATCVLPKETVKTNVLIDHGRIAAVDAPLQTQADEIIDAAGLHLLPGVIDDQVHFRDPGLTHKEDLHTGSLCCAKGGVTTFLEMPNTNPLTINQERLDEKLAIAAQKSVVNFGFYIGATTANIDDLRNATRTPGIKIFLGSSTGDLLVDDQDALERIFAETTLPICAHCEDETTFKANRERIGGGKTYADHSIVRDHEAAIIATRRAIDLAFRHQHRFHVLHVSTRQEAEILKDHRRLITSEVCPHHLFFSIDDYDRLGSLVQMNPSVKTKEDNASLWQALLDGTIQIIATDHAPHTLEEKKVPYPASPSGIPAVENSLALLLNQVHLGKATIEQVVEWMCSGPARIWDIVGKGKIEVGYDADLVLVDLNKTATIRNHEQLTKSKWSPWDGTTLTGWPVRTFVAGRTVFKEGKVDASARGTQATFDHALGGYWKNI